MERQVPGWDRYFLNMLNEIKTRSKDRSVQVGCVIVNDCNSVLSLGYNGFPRGVKDDIDFRHERPLKYKYTEHAERNAIYNAARNGIRLNGARIYVDPWPCAECARAIIQSGLVEVIIDGNDYNNKMKMWSERWSEDYDIAFELFKESEVDCYIVCNEEKILVFEGWRMRI
jgi:dCMP deaminase